jgi:hypothetical protein
MQPAEEGFTPMTEYTTRAHNVTNRARYLAEHQDALMEADSTISETHIAIIQALCEELDRLEDRIDKEDSTP